MNPERNYMSDASTAPKAPKSSKKPRKPRAASPLAAALALIATACADSGADLAASQPKPLVIKSISHQVEHDQQNRVNGVNLVLTIPSLVVSKEIMIEETENGRVYTTPMTRVTEAAGLQPTGPLQAYGHATDIWNGTKGDKDATWFIHNVPCTPALTKIFEALCVKLTQNPEYAEVLRTARLLHSVETARGTVHSLHIPIQSLKGLNIFLFCPIGAEGKPVLNFNEGIVSTTPNITNATIVRDGEAQDRGRNFRGKFAPSARSKQLVTQLQNAIQESDAWKTIQEIKAPSRQERQGSGGGRTTPSRFLSQAPKPMTAPNQAAVADLQF